MMRIRSLPPTVVAERVQMRVEGAMLPAVSDFLADESGDLRSKSGIVDSVTEMTHRTYEEVLAIGEHRRQTGDQMAGDQVAIRREVSRHPLERRPERDTSYRYLED
jgi:hypothetical protein